MVKLTIKTTDGNEEYIRGNIDELIKTRNSIEKAISAKNPTFRLGIDESTITFIIDKVVSIEIV